VSEEALGFEHRDLHWGNVLLQPATSITTSFRFRGQNIEVQTQGMLVTLIDFTASRLQLLTGDVAFCDLEQVGGAGREQLDWEWAV
jgi:serine/threonine-protein kinase haspin